MRIAIVYSNRRKVGGIEEYLAKVMPELSRLGHRLAFLHEVEGPAEREQIEMPLETPILNVSESGVERAIIRLREWRPDLIYCHGLMDSRLESEMLKVAPAIFFAHGYYGTCVSEAKAFKYPVIRPCERRFGWQCLLHYYPHHCGGLNPATMLKLYNLQSNRLEALHRYALIVSHTDHMVNEYIKHGLPAEPVYNFPYSEDLEETCVDSHARQSWRLLFAGRMDRLKGGGVFLDALPEVIARIDLPLQVTFAGDGLERENWQQTAARMLAGNEKLNIEFVGWMDQNRMRSLLSDADLLVVPSLWPEPFGLIGPEAGMMGVPAAAFAVGGIRDWLTDGVNGFLAPADPPTSSGLAQAIIKCLRDPARYARLRRGAAKMAERFGIENHISALQSVFDKVAGRTPLTVPCELTRA